MREYFVYMLKCSDGSFYVGLTNKYQLRLCQHQDGTDPLCYTFTRRPVQLVHLEIFREVLDAIAREKQLKRWSRKKKEALVAERNECLISLAKKDFSNRKHE